MGGVGLWWWLYSGGWTVDQLSCLEREREMADFEREKKKNKILIYMATVTIKVYMVIIAN